MIDRLARMDVRRRDAVPLPQQIVWKSTLGDAYAEDRHLDRRSGKGRTFALESAANAFERYGYVACLWLRCRGLKQHGEQDQHDTVRI